jgi:hypothetical protein
MVAKAMTLDTLTTAPRELQPVTASELKIGRRW